MSKPVKFELEGVQVELKPLDPGVKLRKKRLGLFSFDCAGCGRRRLEVTKDDIKGAGGYTTSEGHARASIFNMVKPAMELDQELKAFHDNAKLGYLEYLRKKTVLDRRRRIRSDSGLSSGGTTSMRIDCPLCDRGHIFQISIISPVEVNEEPNLIALYERRGIHLSDENLDYLTRIVSRGPAAEAPEEFLDRLERLNRDRKTVNETISKVRTVVEAEVNFESDVGDAFKADLLKSLDELGRVLLKGVEGDLHRLLEYIMPEVM